MAGLPTVQVFLDDGTGTFPYDASAYAQMVPGYKGKRGRQDELANVTAGDMSLTFDNTDGRFTLGSTVIASPSPVQVDCPIRVKVLPGSGVTNLLSANDSSFETGIGSWAFNTLLGARTLGTSLAQSTARATAGADSLLITWSTSATGNFAGLSVTTVVGQAYTFVCDVYVPSGSPDVSIAAAFVVPSQKVKAKDTWVRMAVSFVATSTSTLIGIDQTGSTSGQTCYVDNAVLCTGSANQFTGAVQSWPVEWPTGGDELALAAITAVDVQAKGERQPLRSLIEEEIFAISTLKALYTLGEPDGSTSALDTSGNQAQVLTVAGSGSPVVFGNATGPGTDGLTAAQFADGQYLSRYNQAALTGFLACYFATSTNDATVRLILGPVLYLQNGHAYYGNPSAGGVDLGFVADGLVHYFALYASGSVQLDKNAPITGLGTTSSSTLSVGGGVGFAGFIGSVAHVAEYATPGFTASQASSQALAGTTGFAGESGTARIMRLAGYASLPVGTLDTSLTNVAFEDITGKSAIEAIRDVADAELGLVFFDGSGNLTFHNRNRAVSKLAPDVTIDANFLAEGTQFIVDMQGVLNYYEVTAAGTKIVQVARDTVSEDGDGTSAHPKHGRYPGSKTYLVQTDAEALDRGNWLISTHSQPAPRVGSLVVDVLTMTAAQQAAMLTLEANSWLRVTGLPGQTPGSTTADFIVQGFAVAIAATDWSMTINAANKAIAAPTPWILDSSTYSVLDSTTRLYV